MWRLPDAPRASRSAAAALLALLLAALPALPARADTGLLSSKLGRWLDTEVLPELGRTLGEHPRFKGETIRLVSLSGGRPTDASSRLHEAVQAYLTQRLLKRSGVRLAWTQPEGETCGVTQQADYLLGVEIQPDGRNHHQLSIRMIDVAESIWVAGVSHTWHGRLTALEASALRQPVATAPRGTVENPLPASATRAVAKTLLRHLRCAHPRGLDGPVFLENGEDAELNRLLAGLTSELATAPLAALTSHRDEAEWVLSLRARETGTVVELDLMLTEQNGGITQQVATVFMDAGPPGTRRRPPDTRIATSTDAGPDRPAHAGLLSDLYLLPASSEGICRGAESRKCAEVGFDLHRDAYLFVLSSGNRALSALSCDARLVTASAGARRFRVRVPRADSSLPDAGMYVLAADSRKAAKALSRHIRAGLCGQPPRRGSRNESWLARLDALLAEHAGAIEWRAIHLSRTGDGVARL